MERTQIYLDEGQKAALRVIAADRGQNVSDVIRQAIDRLLAEDLAKIDFVARLESVKAHLRERIGDVTEEQIDDASKHAKRRVRAQKTRA